MICNYVVPETIDKGGIDLSKKKSVKQNSYFCILQEILRRKK